eukprot:TRINITY_DN10080_c1_g3_i2.p1 TRINITY_DN10080_c1_g3~~TRINITY_DN10080_c1_g3_i2.p1  ORF type:complete len:557 (-),score=75.52 TRINITY_DN10080_c1_g3_i2:92-1762(-)
MKYLQYLLVFVIVVLRSSAQLLAIDEQDNNLLITSQCNCSDVLPNDLFTCEQQRDWGKCEAIWMVQRDFCAKTCGRCTCETEAEDEPLFVQASVSLINIGTQDDGCTCEDIQPNDLYTCAEQAAFGKCEVQWMIDGGFCEATCGRCSCEPQQITIAESARPVCACDDIPPSTFGTCEQQKQWGKCSRIWMINPRNNAPNGFCATTCGRCTCSQDFIEVDPSTPSADDQVEESQVECSCTDIPPKSSPYICYQQSLFGKCNEPWMLDESQVAGGYCQISCGRCSCFDAEEDPCETVSARNGDVSFLKVSSIGVSQVQSQTAGAVSHAIAAVEDGSLSSVEAAQSSSQAIALAVAEAVAKVTISGCTRGEAAVATGIGSAEAEAFAKAVGSAVADSFASTGESQVQLNVSTFDEVVRRGLSYASASIQISGDADVDIVSSAVSSAVACVLVESLSRAFASLDEGQALSSAIATADECPPELIEELTGLATDDQIFISQSPEPQILLSETITTLTPSPTECVDTFSTVFRRSCAYIAFTEQCDRVLPGECERSCGKCST